MKIFLEISYKGSAYVGWQKQKNGVSVQETIENVISKLVESKVVLCGSGRTDSKVHALCQTATFDIDSEKFFKNFSVKTHNSKIKFNRIKFVNAINANLPSDIFIIKAKEVPFNFHARFSVKEKIYEYHMQICHNPILEGLVGEYKKTPNIKLMKEASKYLIGCHDFSAFCSSKTETIDFIRTINYIKIYKNKTGQIIFEISGNGFLYNMVRIIVGTLYEVGIGKIPVEEIKNILNSKNRTKAGKTAPACGLYLKKVIY